jgi:osmotically-inducible protein OsmY
VITSELKEAIVDEPSLQAFRIIDEPSKGEDQLNGFVNSEQSVRKAEEVIPSGLRGSDWLQITWSL